MNTNRRVTRPESVNTQSGLAPYPRTHTVGQAKRSSTSLRPLSRRSLGDAVLVRETIVLRIVWSGSVSQTAQ